jgi:GT2 family glycosyltransferase
VPGSIDVIVPVRDGYALTQDCLEHLARQTVAHRVIVVDDGSSDGTASRLAREWPEVTTVELGSNQGYTRAVNRGVAAGDGEYVVLVNNDVQLHADCLERLVAPLESDERLGSVAAVMLRPGEAQIDSFGVTADVTLAGFARLQGHEPAEAGVAAALLTGPEGTAGAYRRVAWEHVGGFDERIRAYMEILDLALRLATAGWQTTGAAGAVGVHIGSSTYGRRSAEQRRLAGFSRAYLLRRYGVMRTRAAIRAAATEALVVTGDAVLCRDLQSLRGRWQGWRAAAGHPRRPWPPSDVIDASITMGGSLRLRFGVLPRHRPTSGSES